MLLYEGAQDWLRITEFVVLQIDLRSEIIRVIIERLSRQVG